MDRLRRLVAGGNRSIGRAFSDFNGKSSERDGKWQRPGLAKGFCRFINMSLMHNSAPASDTQSVTGISDRHRDRGSEGGELRLSEIFCE